MSSQPLKVSSATTDTGLAPERYTIILIKGILLDDAKTAEDRLTLNSTLYNYRYPAVYSYNHRYSAVYSYNHRYPAVYSYNHRYPAVYSYNHSIFCSIQL